ncbi:MAG: hypothetical protein ACXVUL_04325 [Solirubrobacteraceae bacterium]
MAQASRGSPRPVGAVLADFLTDLAEDDPRRATDAAEFRERIRSQIAHDRLWSIGTAGEQLTLDVKAA